MLEKSCGIMHKNYSQLYKNILQTDLYSIKLDILPKGTNFDGMKNLLLLEAVLGKLKDRK